MSLKRPVIFSNGEIYHVLNRTIANQEIFISKKSFTRALDLIDFYRFPQKLRFSKFKLLPLEQRKEYIAQFKKEIPLVEIYAFALMPNHYHILLKQVTNFGVVRFISNFQIGFAKYFNLSQDRDGGLFKRPFKAKWIDTDEKFIHVSRYIHLNPTTSYLLDIQHLKSFMGTSLPIYLYNKKSFINNNFLLNKFGGKSEKYLDFLKNQVDYQKKLKYIKDHLLE